MFAFLDRAEKDAHSLFDEAKSVFHKSLALLNEAKEKSLARISELEASIENLNIEKYAHVELQARADKMKAKLEEFLDV